MPTLEEKIDFLIERVLALEFACAKTQTLPPVQMCNSPTQTGLI